MALPNIKQPVYHYGDIEYRGFTHAEEKILLQIKESDDIKTRVTNIMKVLESCTMNKIDVSQLEVGTFEMLFIKIRAASSGEIQKVKYRCSHKNDEGEECGEEFFITINLNEVDLSEKSVIDDTLMLDSEIGIKLKYPTLMDMINANSADEIEQFIDYVYDDESTYKLEDSTDDEKEIFINSIPTSKKKKIKEFIDGMARASYQTNEKCKSCSYKHTIKLKGLNDFFG